MSKKNLLNEAQVRQFMKLAKLAPLTPGFVGGLSERGTYRDEDDLDEVRTGSDPTPNLQSDRRGHGRGRGGADRLEEEDELEAELGATEDELGAEDSLAGEEGDELDALEDEGDLEGDAGGPDKMISVADLLAALEVAIEEVTGEEVSTEMDPDLEDDEMEPDVELDAADDVDMDVEVDAEDELMEGGADKGDQSASRKDYPDAKDGDKETGHGESAGDQSKTKGDYEKNESTRATDELVEQITKRVAARILKSALSKK